MPKEHQKMELADLCSPLPFALRSGWLGRDVGIAVNQRADLMLTNFSAILLAMAGHDLRQPLQVITSAHDVLARILHGAEQRQELARAEGATARLTSMLGQIVEALQLHERAVDPLRVSVPLRRILNDLAAEFAQSARLKGINFRITSARGSALSHPVLLTLCSEI
jgi:two-component system, OmpR family, phosphate regulon sensor histidine kinase PhoR